MHVPDDTAENIAEKITGPPRLIFCEPRGAWAIAMRADVAASIPIHQTRSLAECRQALRRWPGSLLVVELTDANADGLFDWLAALDQADRRAGIIVVARREFEPYQWLVREAGGLAFVTSPRQVRGLASLVQKFFAARPARELPLVERVWSGLPWQDARESASSRHRPADTTINET